MSVIIPNMKMPKTCAECPMNYDECWCTVIHGDESSLLDDYTDKRLDKCPLVEIPDPKVIAARMKVLDIRYHDNEEILHSAADDELCDLLRELGYEEAVDIFDEMPKWYS